MIDPRFYTLSPPLELDTLLLSINMPSLGKAFGSVLIKKPAALVHSQKGDIAFLMDKRRADELAQAKATACFTTEKLAPLLSANHIIPIICDAPRAKFSRAAMALVSIGGIAQADDNAANIHPSAQIDESAHIHPSAYIADNVKIGQGVTIGAYSVIESGVEIGAGSAIGTHCHISFTLIGEACRIKSAAIIGGNGFGVARDQAGLVDIEHYGRVILGARVNIGSQSCVDRGQLGDTVLEDDVKIDNLVQIAHNVHIGARSMLAGHVGISGSCHIGQDCQLGGRVGLADHVSLGDKAIVTAGSGVAQNIPAGQIWGGTPALPFREHMRIFVSNRKRARQR